MTTPWKPPDWWKQAFLPEDYQYRGYAPDQGLQNLPNYERLTRNERWVMDRLPGVMEGPVGQALNWFNEGWKGKILQALDVGAEALERVTGLGTQWVNAWGDPEHMQEFRENLGAAWYAGSLSADLVNLPRWENGRFITYTDLPGIDGVVNARRQISALINQGVDPSEALIQVRDELYEGAGALQLRMQLQDAAFHMGADPINVIMPKLKPIERLKVGSIRRLATGMLPDEIADDLAEFGAKLVTMQEAGAPAEDIARLEANIAKITNTLEISPARHRLLTLMGELPAEGEGVFAKFLRSRWNPFGLRPESRGALLVENVTDNFLARVVSTSQNDPERIMRALHGLVDGTIGDKFGHMIASHEGRLFRGVVTEMLAQADAQMALFRATNAERKLFETMAMALGEDPYKIFYRIKNSGEEAAVWTQFMEAMGTLPPEVSELVTARLDDIFVGLGRQVDANELRLIVEELGDVAMLDNSAFVGLMTEQIGTTAARSAIQQYGIKSKGFIPKMAQMVKSGENLAFLRLNPGYPIRNFVNGEFTMLARGAYGLWTPERIATFWEKMDFEPPRLRLGLGPAEILEQTGEIGGKAYQEGMEIIAKALRGEEIAPDRISRAINNINLGSLDTGRISSRIESAQSARAMTSGAERYFNEYHRVSSIADHSLELADDLGDEAVHIERALSSAIGDAEVEEILLGNLRLSSRGVTDRGSEIAGFDIFGVMQPEEAGVIAERFAQAAERGPTALLDEIDLVEQAFQEKIIAQYAEQSKDLVAEIIARTQTDPGSFARTTTGMADNFYGVHQRNAMQLAELADLAGAADPKVGHQLWRRGLARSQKFYERAFDRINDALKGVDNGFKAIEKQTGQMFPHAKEVLGRWRDWRSGWKKFFDYRNKTLGEFFDAQLAGKEYKLKWGQITEELNNRYASMIEFEDGNWHQMDEIAASLLPEDQRPTFMAARNEVARLRRADRDAVLEFRKMLETLPAEERAAAYNAFTQERMGRWSALEAEEEWVVRTVRGDPEAQARYGQVIAERMAQSEEVVQETLTQTRQRAQEMIDDLDAAMPIERAMRQWTGHGADKADFIKAIQDPDNIEEVAEIQRATREFLDYRYPDQPSIRVTRVESQMPGATNSGEWLSVSELPRGPSGFRGSRWTIEVPKENVFATWQSEGALYHLSGEQEILLNASGLRGARLVEVNGAPPIDEMLRAWEEMGGIVVEPFEVSGLVDFHDLVPRIMPDAVGIDELHYMRGGPAIDAMGQAARELSEQVPLRVSDLSENSQRLMRGYVDQVRGELSDARYMATRFGEYTRDSALLNYSRRFNYNNWLGVLMPYEFWFTQSVFKWALHSIDRPAMLATSMRMMRFLETAYRPEGGFPSRLRGTVRIRVPFMPEWMGNDIFIDPMRTITPFKQFGQPFEALRQRESRDMWATQRALEEMVSDGLVTEQEYEEAISAQAGPVWERAMALARMDDTENRTSDLEVMNMLTSFHAPLVWAYHASRGEPEKIGAFTPIERSIRGVTAALGIGPAGGLNPLGALRRELGLPAFDQWTDYRIDRALSSAAAMGEISVDEALRAMIDRQGPAFEMAVEREGEEFAVGALGSMVGLPAKAYPPGEEHLRELKDDYQAAWERYEEGDLEAMNEFYDENPEYETRLALFKSPQERLSRFLIDELWNTWHEMPKLHQSQVSEHLGELFQMAFLNKETRSYENIPMEHLQVWLAIMGGDPPGEMHYTDTLTPLELAPPDIAHRMEGYYSTRETFFGDEIWDIQSRYFMLDKDARKPYLREYPVLEHYWDWRRDFMYKNPDLAIYIEDDPDKRPKYPSEEALLLAQAQGPSSYPIELFNLIRDQNAGLPLPEIAQRYLEAMGQ